MVRRVPARRRSPRMEMPVRFRFRRGEAVSRAARETFFLALAETSDVRRAARAAGIALDDVFRLRSNDARFRAGWDWALAEGYAQLHMQTLAHVRNRAGGAQGKADDAAPGAPDVASALRMLGQLQPPAGSGEDGGGDPAAAAAVDQEALARAIRARLNALRRRLESGGSIMAQARALEDAARRETDEPMGEAAG
jgi:hypothetical protein